MRFHVQRVIEAMSLYFTRFMASKPRLRFQKYKSRFSLPPYFGSKQNQELLKGPLLTIFDRPRSYEPHSKLLTFDPTNLFYSYWPILYSPGQHSKSPTSRQSTTQ